MEYSVKAPQTSLTKHGESSLEFLSGRILTNCKIFRYARLLLQSLRFMETENDITDIRRKGGFSSIV